MKNLCAHAPLYVMYAIIHSSTRARVDDAFDAPHACVAAVCCAMCTRSAYAGTSETNNHTSKLCTWKPRAWIRRQYIFIFIHFTRVYK